MLKKLNDTKKKMSSDGEFVFVLNNIFESLNNNCFFEEDNSNSYKNLFKYFNQTLRMLNNDNYKLNKDYLDLD